MRISFTDEIEDGRVVVRAIGRIKAASAWHASGAKPESGDWKTIALRNLIRTAEDFEADAIIRVDYEVDGVEASDLAPVSLERVAATGIAVKLSHSRN
jgi:uncharacterized protein YbjQ (UPF0145 family)